MYQFGKIEKQGQLALAEPSPAASFYRFLKHYARAFEKRWRTTDYYRFEKGVVGHDALLCALIGRKPELWPYTLPRLEAAMGDNDVCLTSPGVYSNFLSEFCKARGWSYLSTATDDPALAQNICYKLHPNAELIVKIEEDCFLPRSVLPALVDRFYAVEHDTGYEPGFIAPLVPIDSFAAHIVLSSLGLLEEFEKKFGKRGTGQTKAFALADTDIVRWIWEHTAPLERTAERLANSPDKILLAPVRYDTGLIAFKRTFWEDGGYLPVFRRRVMIGRDTSDTDQCHFCCEAMAQSRPVVIAADLLVGRFCANAQYEEMLPFLNERKDLFTA